VVDTFSSRFYVTFWKKIIVHSSLLPTLLPKMNAKLSWIHLYYSLSPCPLLPLPRTYHMLWVYTSMYINAQKHTYFHAGTNSQTHKHTHTNTNTHKRTLSHTHTMPQALAELMDSEWWDFFLIIRYFGRIWLVFAKSTSFWIVRFCVCCVCQQFLICYWAWNDGIYTYVLLCVCVCVCVCVYMYRYINMHIQVYIHISYTLIYTYIYIYIYINMYTSIYTYIYTYTGFGQ